MVKIKLNYVSYGKEMYSPNDFREGNIEPCYIEVPGWQDARNIEEIRPFIAFIEANIGLKTHYISCGIKPEDLLKYETF